MQLGQPGAAVRAATMAGIASIATVMARDTRRRADKWFTNALLYPDGRLRAAGAAPAWCSGQHRDDRGDGEYDQGDCQR